MGMGMSLLRRLGAAVLVVVAALLCAVPATAIAAAVPEGATWSEATIDSTDGVRLHADIHTYMVDDILTKVDRMSMAVSLESREPLLDHRLLEFAARVPASLKLKDGRGKHLLRKALEAKVPRAILARGKRGFEAPIGEWLRGPLAPMADALLGDGRLRRRGIFNEQELTRLWSEHRTGRADHRHRLWQLMMLELWFRQFIDRAPASRTQYAEAI